MEGAFCEDAVRGVLEDGSIGIRERIERLIGLHRQAVEAERAEMMEAAEREREAAVSRARAEAEAERAEMMEAAEREREAAVNRARAEAEAERAEMMEAAEREREAAVSQAREAFEREREAAVLAEREVSLDLRGQVEALKRRQAAWGDRAFEGVKPKFFDAVYDLIDRSDGARPVADQIADIRERYEEYFLAPEARAAPVVVLPAAVPPAPERRMTLAEAMRRANAGERVDVRGIG